MQHGYEQLERTKPLFADKGSTPGARELGSKGGDPEDVDGLGDCPRRDQNTQRSAQLTINPAYLRQKYAFKCAFGKLSKQLLALFLKVPNLASWLLLIESVAF